LLLTNGGNEEFGAAIANIGARLLALGVRLLVDLVQIGNFSIQEVGKHLLSFAESNAHGLSNRILWWGSEFRSTFQEGV